MAEGIDAAALLKTLGRRGYFRTVDFEPALFAEVARDAFTAGESEAIEGLCESGLAAFMYSQDPSLHPKGSARSLARWANGGGKRSIHR